MRLISVKQGILRCIIINKVGGLFLDSENSNNDLVGYIIPIFPIILGLLFFFFGEGWLFYLGLPFIIFGFLFLQFNYQKKVM